MDHDSVVSNQLLNNADGSSQPTKTQKQLSRFFSDDKLLEEAEMDQPGSLMDLKRPLFKPQHFGHLNKPSDMFDEYSL